MNFWQQLQRILGLVAAPQVVVRSSAKVRPVSPAPVTGRLRVTADSRPLWESRGWRRVGRTLLGAFRTPSGSCAGEILLKSTPEYYLCHPPQALLGGSHAACFRPRGNGKFWVQFSRPSRDVDAGIVAVEDLLARALRQRTTR